MKRRPSRSLPRFGTLPAILILSWLPLHGAAPSSRTPVETASTPKTTAEATALRPVLITVDDLPIAAGRLHPDPAERAAITRDMLSALAKHGVHAVGLVTGEHLRGEKDADLLDLWLKAGHELGNHSFGHLNYTETDPAAYIADIEKERVWLVDFLESRGRTLRFFRFPFLNEGNTPEKLQAMRNYLKRTGQTNLPVTLDNQDWSFEEPWVKARLAGDKALLEATGQDYQAAMRLHVLHHEKIGERLFGHPTPEILLLHAGEVGAAQWDGVFTWLEKTGHRFATADEVLADPAIATPHAFVGDYGYGLWDRLRVAKRDREIPAEVAKVLETQAAAWNRGDLDAFTSVYAADATFVSPGGTTHGRDAVLSRYRSRYPDRAAMGTLSLEPEESRLAEGDEFTIFGDAVPSRVHAVTVAARWRLAFEGKPPATGRTLLVLRARGDTWEIIQDASWSDAPAETRKPEPAVH